MEGIIRNFVAVKVLCHLLLTGIWLYWGIYVSPLTFGMGWWILIGGGILYFIGGMICLIGDHNSDFDISKFPAWACGYSIINLLLIGFMIYWIGLYPYNLSVLLYPAIFVAITLLLYGFSAFGASCLLEFIVLSLWISNWKLNKWYDYSILIVALLIALLSIAISIMKFDKETRSNIAFWLTNFGVCSLINVGLLSLLFFNGLFSLDNFYNVLYLAIATTLFLLVVSTRLITTILALVAGCILWWQNTEFTLLSLIPDLSFEWIHSTWFQITALIIGGLLILALIGYVIYKLMPSKTVYVYRDREKEVLLPMLYNGLSMTCPYCRKTMVTGIYNESTARGIAKTTAKGLLGTSCVASGFAVGASVGGPLAPITGLCGAAIGGAITFFNNKRIDKGINAAIDLWNYEVDGGRTVYFKCPKCGKEWIKTEKYGEIEH